MAWNRVALWNIVTVVIQLSMYFDSFDFFKSIILSLSNSCANWNAYMSPNEWDYAIIRIVKIDSLSTCLEPQWDSFPMHVYGKCRIVAFAFS